MLRDAVRFRALALVGAGALFMATGCRAARMAVPAELESAERLAVEGRQGIQPKGQLRFGTFEAAKVERSWMRGSGVQVEVYNRERRRQEYSFTLTESQQPMWQVVCQAQGSSQTLERRGTEVELESGSSLHCAVTPASGGDAWQLELMERSGKPLSGTLRSPSGDKGLDVMGVTRMEGSSLNNRATTGYEIRKDGQAVAAVDVIDSGAVLLRPSLDAATRGLASVTAAALLLMDSARPDADE